MSQLNKNMTPKNLKLGIDLGGTKIEICILENGQEIIRKRVATPLQNYAEIIQVIKVLVQDVDAQIEQKLKVGIGTPGAISFKTGFLKNSNTICMNGMPILQDLEQALKRPVKIQNDANCFALSEAIDGAGEGEDTVFGVIIGTGTGAGLVHKQQLIVGPNSITGEWGHNPLPWPNTSDEPILPCYCGKQACVETYLSGAGMQQRFAKLYAKELNSRQIVKYASQGDEQCRQHLNHYYDAMARAMASVINILDPNVVVLGGGMSNIQAIYTEIQPRLLNYVFSDQVNTRIVPAKYGDSSGVRGAAWLW